MRVGLITVFSHEHCTLKDVAGGFGTVFRVGSSRAARLLERAKREIARLPPPTLGYVAARARAAGHTACVVELARHGRKHDSLPAGLDIACVLTSIVDAEAERAVMRELRARGVHTIAIGSFASARPEYFADAAHVVVQGEAEAMGDALFDTSARGIVKAGFVDDLDALPFPDWAPFPVASYRYALLANATTLPIQGARGCAFGCGYCPFRATSPFRERDPERVVAEAQMLRDTYGARALSFRDPLFNLSIDRTRALARGLKPLGLRFSGEMRADRLDESVLTELRDAGLRSLEIGVESTNLEMLATEKRSPPSLEQIHEVVRCAHKLGIRVIANFMFGLPTDTEESIRETVALAKKLNTFAVQFTIATPYPGTTLETRVRNLLHAKSPTAQTGFAPTFTHPSLTADRLEQLREWAYVSYHYRPRYAARFATSAAGLLGL